MSELSLLFLRSKLFAALKHAEKEEEEEEDGDENFKCLIMLSTLFFLHGMQGDTRQVIEAKGRPSLSSGFLSSFVFICTKSPCLEDLAAELLILQCTITTSSFDNSEYGKKLKSLRIHQDLSDINNQPTNTITQGHQHYQNTCSDMVKPCRRNSLIQMAGIAKHSLRLRNIWPTAQFDDS
ncbi:hypothetical protein Peur_069994 [Populus x canadensis]